MPVKKLNFTTAEQREREENVFLRVYLGEATQEDIASLPKSMSPTIAFCLAMSKLQRMRGNQHELPLGEVVVHNALVSRITETPYIDPEPRTPEGEKLVEPLTQEIIETHKEISQPTSRKRR